MCIKSFIGRFLPDKAIDLIDESCAHVRVALDTEPEIIDQLERRKLQLEVEATALSREKDAASQQRLLKVSEEKARIEEELKPLRIRYEHEKTRIFEIQDLNKKLDTLKIKLEDAKRRYDLALAADLQYGAIPDIEKKIQELTDQHHQQDEDMSDVGSDLLTEDVGPDQILDVISRWTGIPLTRLTQTQTERLLELGNRLKSRVIGQDPAVESIAQAILRSRSGLCKPNRPVGSFLFLGSTGVGKTELAKALAFELFDDEKHMIRIDMSEYMEKHSVSRLIGAPPGYVGFESGGQLSEAVRRRPYSVILLDEVEKAHSDVLNILLQVLDDGRLTDGQGRTVDFSNTVIILTSNVGSQFINQHQGVITPSISSQIMELVRMQFKPEFLNRLDDIVIFNPLTNSSLSKIVLLQMESIQALLANRNVEIKLDPSSIPVILNESYNPGYGARPIRRYLEKTIITQLSLMILDPHHPLKNDSIVIVYDAACAPPGSIITGKLAFVTIESRK